MEFWGFRFIWKFCYNSVMRIAIIGGGAAGLMCAATLAESGIEADIFLIEKNSGLGKKVLISGGGRCNVTTGLTDVRELLKRYPRGSAFLQKAMYHFPPLAVRSWFEDRGVPLKVEEDLRVFPVSDQGSDIVGVFETVFSHGRVNVFLGRQVTAVQQAETGFVIQYKNHPQMEVDAVVFTTGGQAYRQTGSTGDGYAFAESLGHTITPLAASLSAFILREPWPGTLAGISWPKAKLSSGASHWTGPFLFTHKGITGPAVFALSAMIAFELCTPQSPLLFQIDLFPDTSIDELTLRIKQKTQEQGKKALATVLTFLMPRAFVDVCLDQLYLNPMLHAAELSKEDIHRLVEWLKGIPLHAISRVAGDEFVTAGGVETKEVDPRTMESLHMPGIYFAGEILNIDGFTGGFNLQASWATGHLAAEAIVAAVQASQ